MNENHWFAQEDLRLRIRSGASAGFQGVVVRADDARLVADFPRATAPSLAIGRAVPLSLSGPSLVDGLETDGRVVARSEDFFRQRYEFEVARESALPLERALEQRRAPRVTPTDERPIAAVLATLDGARSASAIVVDVSTTGIALALPFAEEEHFADAWEVKLVLTIGVTSFHVAGTVRGRRALDATHVHYAVEFDPSHSRDFEATHRAVRDYVERARNNPGPAETTRGASARVTAHQSSESPSMG